MTDTTYTTADLVAADDRIEAASQAQALAYNEYTAARIHYRQIEAALLRQGRSKVMAP